MSHCCRIRTMCQEDASLLTKAFHEQGWNREESQMLEYYSLQQQGKHTVLVAEYDGNLAGYLLVRPMAQEGPFRMQGIPELADFNVLIKYQRKGIGTALMDAAENLCVHAGRVCLAVGLHSGYGQAQRMYIKRGYLFDGSGVWYQGKQLEQYAPCVNDDDLVLYLSKNLK